jgi:hypothetical protein
MWNSYSTPENFYFIPHIQLCTMREHQLHVPGRVRDMTLDSDSALGMSLNSSEVLFPYLRTKVIMLISHSLVKIK